MDKKSLDFKDEFRITDARVTSEPCRQQQKADIVLEWNEPKAIAFIDQNIPTEHLMYVLEIDPPVENEDSSHEVTLVPDCNGNGGCIFHKIDKGSSIDYVM